MLDGVESSYIVGADNKVIGRNYILDTWLIISGDEMFLVVG